MDNSQRPEIDADLMKPLEEALKTVDKVATSSSAKKLPHEFIERLWTIGVAAVGLIAAFAWDRFLRELIDVLFAKGESLWVLFLYAILMTLIAAFVAINIPWLERWYRKHIKKHHSDSGDMKAKNEPHIPVGKNL